MKPKLLLLHGALGSSEIFAPLVDELKNDYELTKSKFKYLLTS
jgi:hypothetical protein